MSPRDAEEDSTANHERGFTPQARISHQLSSRGLAQYRRALLLAAPFVFATFFFVANGVIPAIWQQPVLQRLFLKPCALYTTTGIPCPFCGATRSTVFASQGLWLQSLRMHPAGMFLIAGGALMTLWCTACAISGRDLGLSRCTNSVLRSMTARRLFLLVLLLWLYTIVANLKR